jgi:L-fuculose-phosphate aldolase
MGSVALADVAAENILKSDILLLENHGILTTGSNLLQAFDKIEVLENAAKMTLMSEMTGRKKPLDRARILELERLFR